MSEICAVREAPYPPFKVDSNLPREAMATSLTSDHIFVQLGNEVSPLDPYLH